MPEYPVSLRYEHGTAAVLPSMPDADGLPTLFVFEFHSSHYGVHGTIYVSPSTEDAHASGCSRANSLASRLTGLLGPLTSRIDNEGQAA